MKYEDIYEYIGHIGRYQWLVFSLVCVIFLHLVDSIQIVFIGGNMVHWCHVDELDGLPYDIQKKVAIPTETSADGLSTVYSSCKMFALNYSVYNQSEFETWNRTQMLSNNLSSVSCDRWTYDQSTFQSTIVKKFDLVCGRDFLNQLASTLLMAGIMLGTMPCGLLSDKFGRKKTMLLYSCVQLGGHVMSVFGPNYAVFVVGRFLIGFGEVGLFLPGFALVMELVGPKYRSILGCSLQIAFASGFMLQPAIAYFLRDEFTYQLAAVGPTFIFPLIILFALPESTRWLILHRRYDEATKQLQRICRINRVKLPPDFDLRHIDTETAIKKKSCLALLTSPEMRLRAVLIDCSWFTCSLIYYALALNTGTLYGNIYINTFFSGAVEILAHILAIWMMDRKLLGRRLTGSLALLVSGLVAFLCIPLILFNFNIEATILSIIGKAVISIAFSVVYVFASEVFPTEIRSVAMGSGNLFSRFASMAASFVGGPLANVWKPLPSLVFGLFSTLSGLSCMLLPETLGQPLLDTIDEVERSSRCTVVGHRHRINCMSRKTPNNGDIADNMADKTLSSLSSNLRVEEDKHDL